jgi:hypothetical protein
MVLVSENREEGVGVVSGGSDKDWEKGVGAGLGVENSSVWSIDKTNICLYH